MNTADHLPEIADYCHVEENDSQLSGFIATAEESLADAGVSSPAEGSGRAARYLQCVKYLTLDQYDRRDAAVEGSLSDNPAFRRIINQLKLSEPVPESGTE